MFKIFVKVKEDDELKKVTERNLAIPADLAKQYLQKKLDADKISVLLMSQGRDGVRLESTLELPKTDSFCALVHYANSKSTYFLHIDSSKIPAKYWSEDGGTLAIAPIYPIRETRRDLFLIEELVDNHLPGYSVLDSAYRTRFINRGLVDVVQGFFPPEDKVLERLSMKYETSLVFDEDVPRVMEQRVRIESRTNGLSDIKDLIRNVYLFTVAQKYI